MKQIEVVAAIIYDSEGRIFATQRGYGDYKDWWEFPGGMGLSSISSFHALLPLSCGERTSGTERTRGSEVAQQG